MNILEQIRSFEFDKNRKKLFGIKSGIVWGHSKTTNGSFPMIKWFRIVRWIRAMRKKYNRYDFKGVTSDSEIIFYIDKEEDELRLKY